MSALVITLSVRREGAGDAEEIPAGVYDLQVTGRLNGAACSVQSFQNGNWFPVAPPARGGHEPSAVFHSLPHSCPRLEILEDCKVRLMIGSEPCKDRGKVSADATLTKVG